MISATYLRLMAKELGINSSTAAVFLRGTDISYEQLLVIDGKFSFTDLITISENVLEALDEPAIGLMLGAELDIASHGLLGMVLMSSPTVKVMLEAYVRYAQVSAQFLNVSLKDTPEHYILETDPPAMGEDVRRTLLDLIFSTGLRIVEQATGKVLSGAVFKFAHPEPEYKDKYADVLHSEVQFSCDKYQLCIPIALGEIPSLFANEALFNNARLLCEEQLKAHQHPVSLANKLKKLFYDNPGDIWTNIEVAKALNMSPRTLARRLKDESTSYKDIREETQKELAVQYLLRESLSVERAAYLMGYTDSSNFRRSFKRWFGMTPSEYIGSRKTIDSAE